MVDLIKPEQPLLTDLRPKTSTIGEIPMDYMEDPRVALQVQYAGLQGVVEAVTRQIATNHAFIREFNAMRAENDRLSRELAELKERFERSVELPF